MSRNDQRLILGPGLKARLQRGAGPSFAGIPPSVLVPGSLKVTGASNEPSSNSNDSEIVIIPNGSGGLTIQL
jgi:hypothetical protein